MIGIYKITNLINNKTYIGQSSNIERRWQQHRSIYEWNRHPNYPLYKAMIKYGLNNFKFEIIEVCDIAKLNESEQYWIKQYQSLIKENGYNISNGGASGIGENHNNHKLTEQDVIDIRNRYNNHERCKEVEKLYQDKIGHSGFSKIWKGETWTHIMMEVYTPENKDFHLHNTAQKGQENGRAKVSAEDVYKIRLRKKNGEKRADVYKDYEHTGITFGSFTQIWCYQNWLDIKVD